MTHPADHRADNCPVCAIRAARSARAEVQAGPNEPTCRATSFGVPADDHVTTCWASATEEWLDLTGQWIPVCDAHGRGRGVPEDRLRPLPAEPAPRVVRAHPNHSESWKP